MSWNTGPALPATMRAVQLTGYGPPDRLSVADIPLPAMAPHNEVLIEVHAAGLNPFEAKLRRGWLAGLFPLSLPHVLGNDVAGVIAAKGFDVSEFEIGERVWAMLDPLRPGSYAEYAAAPSYLVRRMPERLDFAAAAAVPMAACTAWHGLHHLGGIKAGDRVLVQAASGGVGSFAVQIAKAAGAWVAATASAANLDFVRDLGADQVIDYGAADFCAEVGDIDIVLDVIGGEVGQRCYRVLKPGGTLLVVLRGDETEMVNRAANMAQYGVTTKVVAFSAQPQALDALGALIDSGAIRVPLERSWDLAEAAAAHVALDHGHARGKSVLRVR